jgi:hypothetical protein
MILLQILERGLGLPISFAGQTSLPFFEQRIPLVNPGINLIVTIVCCLSAQHWRETENNGGKHDDTRIHGRSVGPARKLWQRLYPEFSFDRPGKWQWHSTHLFIL